MMHEPFRLADDSGAAKIIHVHEPSLGLQATLTVDVTTEECFRLARAMILKNAAAWLAHGSGKSVLRGAPRMPLGQKE